MQKNLLTKTLIVIAVLLVFLYGIFGIPSGLNGTALKAAVLKNIRLGDKKSRSARLAATPRIPTEF